ncbi:hypothetical protein NTE_01290 [Candidatus Nitrososphaera evergladensis SR1]|uniref:Uncharacterized protein n=1 Tax=Candidatus Nitrososphaera evergladensis SR1 TaxID=1459636 RepID=A0A075MVN2_9ARCH|nr:DUF1428 family protein [Candidatus Nitrososphaera evergladensis]AIF83359.1 hypothetical protein NTE_01290 [Candidatus Nitrososphaera evergladensis SR1]
MNNSTTEPAREIEIGSYVALTFWRAPKKNRDAVVQVGRQNDQIWRKHGMLRSETFLLGTRDVPTGCKSIANILSAADEGEDLWVLQQFFRDRDHADKVLSNVIKDESINKVVKEFYGEIAQGQSLVTGGFSRIV